MSGRELTYGEAVREALAEEMRRDPRVVLIGEDVAETAHPFRMLSGLVQEFGPKRVIDVPISETGYPGIGVGAAMSGLRPVVDLVFNDNPAAKAHHL
jgi:pyruvate/2-oxoglutarate/acetoin dehydrogenase E1 component